MKPTFSTLCQQSLELMAELQLVTAARLLGRHQLCGLVEGFARHLLQQLRGDCGEIVDVPPELQEALRRQVGIQWSVVHANEPGPGAGARITIDPHTVPQRDGYRLVIKVWFPGQMVFIKLIGTHAECDRVDMIEF